MVVDCNSIFEHWIHLCIKNIKCSIYVKQERRIHQWDQESKHLLNITMRSIYQIVYVSESIYNYEMAAIAESKHLNSKSLTISIWINLDKSLFSLWISIFHAVKMCY